MSDATAAGARVRGSSLRTRWTRAFAGLLIALILSGVASLLGTWVLVETFRDAAVRVERAASIDVQLRADVIAHALVVSNRVSAAQQQQLRAVESAVRVRYGQALDHAESARPRALLEDSRRQWEALVAATAPNGRPADQATRGAAVAAGSPKVLAALDQAGTASRAAVRAELAVATRMERQAMALLGALILAAILLVVRLTRRLSTEILGPVGHLRDSANQLASGNLEHRAVVFRPDELGELAGSFNAMADAIAGSHRGLQREANTDSLSGLPNRSAFWAQLAAELAETNHRAGTQAVLFVDLDDFKDVNDTLGHAAGDELLRVVAERLSAAVRPGDLVARLGGDEFALLLVGVFHPGSALAVAERVVESLAEPVQIGQHWAHVGASVGLAMRGDGSTPDTLMREADVAMYAAKGKGKNRVERYNPDLDEGSVPRQVFRAATQVVTGTAP